MERHQELVFEVKRIHGAPKVEVVPIVIGVLGTVSKNAKVWHKKLSLPEFIPEVHSCQPSLALLTSCGKCCGSK